MGTTVNLRSAKKQPATLVDRAAAGEGRPGFGRDKGQIKIHRNFDDPLPDEFLQAFGIAP